MRLDRIIAILVVLLAGVFPTQQSVLDKCEEVKCTSPVEDSTSPETIKITLQEKVPASKEETESQPEVRTSDLPESSSIAENTSNSHNVSIAQNTLSLDDVWKMFHRVKQSNLDQPAFKVQPETINKIISEEAQAIYWDVTRRSPYKNQMQMNIGGAFKIAHMCEDDIKDIPFSTKEKAISILLRDSCEIDEIVYNYYDIYNDVIDTLERYCSDFEDIWNTTIKNTLLDFQPFSMDNDVEAIQCIAAKTVSEKNPKFKEFESFYPYDLSERLKIPTDISQVVHQNLRNRIIYNYTLLKTTITLFDVTKPKKKSAQMSHNNRSKPSTDELIFNCCDLLEDLLQCRCVLYDPDSPRILSLVIKIILKVFSLFRYRNDLETFPHLLATAINVIQSNSPSLKKEFYNNLVRLTKNLEMPITIPSQPVSPSIESKWKNMLPYPNNSDVEPSLIPQKIANQVFPASREVIIDNVFKVVNRFLEQFMNFYHLEYLVPLCNYIGNAAEEYAYLDKEYPNSFQSILKLKRELLSDYSRFLKRHFLI